MVVFKKLKVIDDLYDFPDLTKSSILTLAENYVKTLRYEYHSKVSSLSNKQFIIDKLPMNFRWIGFIVKAFPEAKIIHIQRKS